MMIRTLCVLALIATLARSAPHRNDDEWQEVSSEFNGLLGTRVEHYTCGNVQIGACSPRGGSCSSGIFGSGIDPHCECQPGFYQHMCDWGPTPPNSNGIDWTDQMVARIALALDASTAAYANNTINGVIQTTVEAQCPDIMDDYDFFHMYDFASMTTHECGGILECGSSSMDTQAVFGSVKASSAPSGKPELMISFRGTEMSDVFTGFQKFQDLTSDLNIGRKFLYINSTGAPCTDNSQCTYIGYVHGGFYNSLAPFMDTILVGVANMIADMNGIDESLPFEAKVRQMQSTWDQLHIPEITISGHSLGSSIATICATVVNAVFPLAKVHLYTFASPRVGGPLWASLIESTENDNFDIIRFVNKHDPVTMIPTSLGGGDPVVHVGRQETIDFGSISDSCSTWFLDSQYSIISAGVSYMTGCLDVSSHTDYYNHVVTWLRSKGYNKPQKCLKGSC